MPIKVLQPSFSGGVFSPSLYGRVDLQKYATGLRTARNFFVHPHGGASNRQGTEYIAAAKYSDKKCRIIPFEFSTEQAYVLEFGEKYIRFFKPDGSPVISTSTYSEFSPSATYAANSVKKVGNYHDIDFGGGKHLYIAWAFGEKPFHPDYPSKKWKFKVTTNPYGDSLRWGNRVSDADGDYEQDLQLANATPSKNTAKLIQDFIRANADLDFPELANVVVTANAAYGSAPVTSANIPGAPWVDCNRAYINSSTVTGTADNISSFPPAGTPWSLSLVNCEVATPFSEMDLNGLKFAQSADVLYISHPRFSPRFLSRLADDSWTLSSFAFKNGPFMPSNVSTTTLSVSGTTMTASANTFVKGEYGIDGYLGHKGSLWEIRHQMEGQKSTVAFSSATAAGGIKCGKTWRLITHGTWTATIRVEKSTDGGNTWSLIRSFSSANDNNVNTYGDVDEPCQVRLNCTPYTSGTCNADLTTDPYEHIGIVKITSVTSATSAAVEIVKEVGATTATTDWSEGSWSHFRGWPSAVAFNQDRLCFGGNKWEAQTTWMSQTGIYDDFGRSVPLVDSDGISVNLPARKMNGIKNLVTLNDLLALTASSEWRISSSGAALTPTNVQVYCQGYRGCSNADPVVIGNRILYFQPMGAILRDMGYSLESDGYDSSDLSVISSHFFDNHSIVEMAYQQEPDSLLWCVRDDGKLLALTYMREQEVFAWTMHETDGEFESVCTIPGGGYNEVWFVVKRTINGSTVRYIERLTQRMISTDPADQIFMDCSKSYSGTATTTITGLSHLEGKSVSVLADGNEVTGLSVSGGQITLSNAASKVHVGLGYVCDLETLNVELNLNTGTTQGSMVKIASVLMRFLNSRGGKVGPNSEKLDTDVVLRDVGDVSAVEPLHSKDVKLNITSSYDIGGRIFYRQESPLPVTILAIIPYVAVAG